MLIAFIPDAGDRYLSKVYNDAWMSRHQYWEAQLSITAGEVVRLKQQHRPGSRLIYAKAGETAHQALRLMQDNEVSQVPVFEDHVSIGTVREDDILNLALRGVDLDGLVLRECMKDPLPVLDPQAPIDRITYLLTNESPAVLVDIGDNKFEILTKYDLIDMIATLADSATTLQRRPT